MTAISGPESSSRASCTPYSTSVTSAPKAEPPPENLTATTVLHCCADRFQTRGAGTLRFPHYADFSERIYGQDRRGVGESGSECKLRLTSTEEHPIIVQLVRSGAHEAAALGFGFLIADAFNRSTGKDFMDFFYPLGAKRVKLDSPYKTAKEADFSFAPVNTKSPTLVIEIGRPDTIRELRADMARWFTVDSIKMVILIEIGKPVASNTEVAAATPTLTVETCFRAIDPASRPKLTKSALMDWTHGVSDVVEIPLWALLGLDGPESPLEDGLPAVLTLGAPTLNKLRNNILLQWREEENEEQDDVS
ncbi:hypothetical protein FB451DRAFT_87042 [Mycena latifolia]|nr:hypothetical protein FB451DRAFT_87042 [Mycena latifolia]